MRQPAFVFRLVAQHYLLPDDQLGFWAVTVGPNNARGDTSFRRAIVLAAIGSVVPYAVSFYSFLMFLPTLGIHPDAIQSWLSAGIMSSQFLPPAGWLIFFIFLFRQTSGRASSGFHVALALASFLIAASGAILGWQGFTALSSYGFTGDAKGILIAQLALSLPDLFCWSLLCSLFAILDHPLASRFTAILAMVILALTGVQLIWSMNGIMTNWQRATSVIGALSVVIAVIRTGGAYLVCLFLAELIRESRRAAASRQEPVV